MRMKGAFPKVTTQSLGRMQNILFVPKTWQYLFSNISKIKLYMIFLNANHTAVTFGHSVKVN